MKLVTIPKKLAERGDLVLLPKEEYEEFLELKKIRTFRPTKSQKRALRHAEKNLKAGKTLSFDEFARRLEVTNRSKRL